MRDNEDWARSICARADIKFHDHYAGLTAHFLSIADRLLDERDAARQVVEELAKRMLGLARVHADWKGSPEQIVDAIIDQACGEGAHEIVFLP